MLVMRWRYRSWSYIYVSCRTSVLMCQTLIHRSTLLFNFGFVIWNNFTYFVCKKVRRSLQPPPPSPPVAFGPIILLSCSKPHAKRRYVINKPVLHIRSWRKWSYIWRPTWCTYVLARGTIGYVSVISFRRFWLLDSVICLLTFGHKDSAPCFLLWFA